MKYASLNGRPYDTVEELTNDFANLTYILGFDIIDLKQLKHPVAMQVSS